MNVVDRRAPFCEDGFFGFKAADFGSTETVLSLFLGPVVEVLKTIHNIHQLVPFQFVQFGEGRESEMLMA